MEVLQETLRQPSGIQGPPVPDGYIQNYDSPYHIIFTNVKTESQISAKRRVNSLPIVGLRHRIGMLCARGANDLADALSPASWSGTV
jgi:hypothetical protein